MRIKIDHPDTGAGHDGQVQRPYPTWHEVLSRLNRDRPGQSQAPAAAPQTREWHDLVADMILRR